VNAGGTWSRAREFLAGQPGRFVLVFVVLVGAGCGLVAVAFHLALGLSGRLLSGAIVALPHGPLRVVLILLVPAAAGALLNDLVPRFAPAAGGGLTLVRKAYAGEAKLDLRTFCGAFVANVLSLGAGTPLGPEGPTVVLTSTFATAMARRARLPLRLVRGMIPVGTAAGIASIFGAPMTGVVFALEEVIGTASRGVLGSALLAAVAAAVVERGILGGERLLPAPPGAWHDPRELAGFALLGVACGVVAGGIPRVVPRVEAAFGWLSSALPRGRSAARGALAGFAVGLLGLLSPDSLGIGYDAVSRWLGGGGTARDAGLAFAAKLAGVVLSLSAPLVGGFFAPSLFLGASLGAALGHGVHHLFPALAVLPGSWALVGMGAFFAGFLRTPIASVLIVFELTGDYGLVLPQMLAVALAVSIARRLSPETLVERQLADSGISIGERPHDPLSSFLVRDVMGSPAIAVRLHDSLLDAARAVAGTNHPFYPVVGDSGTCVGLLPAAALDEAARLGRMDDAVASRLAPAPLLLPETMPLADATLALARAGITRAAVVAAPGDARPVGFLSPSDILRARLRTDERDSA
jgi:chloride channel protein, CIC family